MVVVVVAPVAEDPLYLVRVREPMLREALSPARAVERFDEGVVRRLAGSAEVKLDVIPVGPVVESLAGELGSVVDAGPGNRDAASFLACRAGSFAPDGFGVVGPTRAIYGAIPCA